MTARGRVLPREGDAVEIVYRGSVRPGTIEEVDGPRVLVLSEDQLIWFEISRITGWFVKAGEAYSPRLRWVAADDAEDGD